MKRWFERLILNPKAKVIARSIRDNPEGWSPYYLDGKVYTIRNNNLAIWVANGWWFVGIYEPRTEKLGLLGRTLVWWEAKRLIWKDPASLRAERARLDEPNRRAIEELNHP